MPPRPFDESSPLLPDTVSFKGPAVVQGSASGLTSELDAKRRPVYRSDAESTEPLKCTKLALASTDPIDILPHEVMLQIFGHLADQQNPITLPLSRASLHEMRWILRHMCSRWRDIALKCHQLWNSVQVESSFPRPRSQSRDPIPVDSLTTECRWERRVEIARSILATAGPVDLSFRIFAETSEVEYKMADLALHDLIRPNEARIVRLELDGSMKVHDTFIHGSRHYYPQLRSLILARSEDLCDDTYRDADRTDQRIGILPTDFDQFLHLRTVQLLRVDLIVPIAGQRVEVFQNLVELTITGGGDNGESFYHLAFDDILPSLMGCRELVRLKISGADFCDLSYPPSDVTLPRLETIHLGLVSDRRHDRILDFFTLPSLIELHIAAAVNEDDQDPKSLLRRTISLIERSSCSDSLNTLALEVDDDMTYGGPLMDFDRQLLDKLVSLLPLLARLHLTLPSANIPEDPPGRKTLVFKGSQSQIWNALVDAIEEDNGASRELFSIHAYPTSEDPEEGEVNQDSELEVDCH